MGRLALHVAGESHGPGLLLILSGLPRGVPFNADLARGWLARRRSAPGRGPRAGREPDSFRVISGLTGGCTNGGPVSFLIENADASGRSSSARGKPLKIEFPRPGHADLAGALKWRLDEATEVAELASARITAAYTLAGSLCQSFLDRLRIRTLAHVLQIGPAQARPRAWTRGAKLSRAIVFAEVSPLLCLDNRQEPALFEAIEEATRRGDTLGGLFEIVAAPVPPGLGAPQPLEARLDGRLAGLLMAIPGLKAVGIGQGFEAARALGSRFHGSISHLPGRGFFHSGNAAGGIDGGMTNGEPLVVQGIMKPVASLSKPLPSASLASGKAGVAPTVRSDVCAVVPAAIVARALVAFLLADEILASTGGDSLPEVRKRLEADRRIAAL
jgi:chorismate synthase